MKKILLITLLVLVAGSILALRDYIFPVKVNYKITVEVETPKGTKTGSAVRQLQVSKNSSEFMGAGGLYYDQTIGEAVAVKISEDKTIFYLINWDFNELEPFIFREGRVVYKDKIEFYRNLNVGTTYKLEGITNSVYIDDDGIIKTIDGDAKKILGISFISKTAEITNEPITTKIEPFLQEIKSWLPFSRQDFQFKG